MKAHRAETPHTTLQKDTFEFIMTDQQTAEPHPHPAQLREAPSDLLADLRAKIDVIDAKLSALIVERLAIADEIGERKRGRNLPIHAPKREEALLEKLAERASGSSPLSSSKKALSALKCISPGGSLFSKRSAKVKRRSTPPNG